MLSYKLPYKILNLQFNVKNILILFLIFCFSKSMFPQPVNDYINTNQYKKFRIRKKMIASWQINQLSDSGALVVRLKSNKKAIDILFKKNQIKAANELKKSTFNQNKIIVDAFLKYYNFSKLYFIYDYSSDSLRKGWRKGFFLNAQLTRDSSIVMREKFYLIAEQGELVQSSIGLIPDSLAAKETERGTPVKQVAIVIRNKYGHQLKHPFPYYIKGTNLKKYSNYLIKLNKALREFKSKNPRQDYPSDLKPFMY